MGVNGATTKVDIRHNPSETDRERGMGDNGNHLLPVAAENPRSPAEVRCAESKQCKPRAPPFRADLISFATLSGLRGICPHQSRSADSPGRARLMTLH